MTTGLPISQNKAKAILRRIDRASAYEPDQDYFVATTDGGPEELVTYEGTVVATNRETTSWIPKIELAAQDTHGGWELIGDYDTREAAIEAAIQAAPHCHHDDFGGVVFGLSSDPDSGHYEDRFGMFFEDGAYVLVDPLP
jgi:hypothetical protein